MYDELLSVLAHARIAAMLREAEHYRMIVECRPLPKSKPDSITRLRRNVASILYHSAAAIEPQATTSR